MKLVNLFMEGQNYSWRKIMTACCLIVFIVAEVGFLVTHDFNELPASYTGVNGAVFGFYFMRRLFKNGNSSLTTEQ